MEKPVQLDGETKAILLQMVLNGPCPPHLIILFICNKILGWTADRVAETLMDLRMSDLLRAAGEEIEHQHTTPSSRHSLEPLRAQLNRPLKDIVASKSFTARHPGLLNKTFGETRLNDYYPGKTGGETIAAILSSWDSEKNLIIIAKAQGGDDAAFSEIYKKRDRELRGFIRTRCARDSDVEEIAQTTWIKMAEKIGTYNPAFSSFRRFIKFWALFEIMNYSSKNYQRLTMLFSELSRRFPEFENENEILEAKIRLESMDAPAETIEFYSGVLKNEFQSFFR
jgi:hypothetical protein